jgi:hypothetical protein
MILFSSFFATMALLFNTFFAMVGASLAVTCFTILVPMLFAGIVIAIWEAATASMHTPWM